MSLIRILDISANFVKTTTSETFRDELANKIEKKLADLNEIKGLPYDKNDIAQLISTMETYKMKCLKGEISAKRLYCDVGYALTLFKIKHPGFDYLKDPAIDAYYS